jgi:hypothetical protein
LPGVADTDTGAARQPWWAASAVLALAVAGLTAFQLLPASPVVAELSWDLAFAVAGYAATRLLLARRDVDRPLVEAWAAALLWALPALVAVMLAVLATGLFLLPPADLTDQAWTVMWSAYGSGGDLLMKQGVPDPAMSGSLLLHLWAPGVAVQLFFGWSVVVGVMSRWLLLRWIGALAGLGAVVSLGLDLWMRGQGLYPQVFYLAPPNAWPFLIGAAVVTLSLRPTWPERPAGLVLARFGGLAWPFHLWLWPLATLPRMILARPLTLIETAMVLGGAALLAVLTRRWVETPVRLRLAGHPRTSLALAVASMVLISLIAGALVAARGLPWRADARLRADEAAAWQRPPLHNVCHVESIQTPPVEACTIPRGEPADVIVWGNSHAAHLTPAIFEWTTRRGLRMRQVTKSGCLPLLQSDDGLAAADCLAFNRSAVRQMAEGPPPRIVIVGAAWTLVMARMPGDDAAEVVELERDLAVTLRRVRAAVGPEAAIVLLGDTPDFTFAPAACHTRRRFLGLDTRRCDLAAPGNAAMAGVMDGVLARVAAAQPRVSVFDPAAALCVDGLCRTREPDAPWYVDRNHLTLAGGLAQAESLARVLDTATADR